MRPQHHQQAQLVSLAPPLSPPQQPPRSAGQHSRPAHQTRPRPLPPPQRRRRPPPPPPPPLVQYPPEPPLELIPIDDLVQPAPLEEQPSEPIQTTPLEAQSQTEVAPQLDFQHDDFQQHPFRRPSFRRPIAPLIEEDERANADDIQAETTANDEFKLATNSSAKTTDEEHTGSANGHFDGDGVGNVRENSGKDSGVKEDVVEDDGVKDDGLKSDVVKIDGLKSDGVKDNGAKDNDRNSGMVDVSGSFDEATKHFSTNKTSVVTNDSKDNLTATMMSMAMTEAPARKGRFRLIKKTRIVSKTVTSNSETTPTSSVTQSPVESPLSSKNSHSGTR